MSDYNINRETLTTALEESVAERGEDFVYPDEWRYLTKADKEYGSLNEVGTCQYVLDDGTPACIFGMALMKLGVPATELQKRFTGIIGILEELGVEDYKLHSAGVEAQSAQDNGATWRDALYRWKHSLEGTDKAAQRRADYLNESSTS